MTAPRRGGRLRGSRDRRCTLCGCELAHDEPEAVRVCSPCHRKTREYNPTHDPLFGERLLELLVANRGRPVNVYRELGIEPCGIVAWRCVANHVEYLRRHGHRIEGGHDGYTYRGRRQPKGPRVRLWESRRNADAVRCQPRG